MTTSVGFHDGELAVQQRAGVGALAARLSGMLAPPDLNGGASRFLAERRLAVLTARDRDDRLWTSPLLGSPGFLDGHDTTLRVHAAPAAGDPLADLVPGQAVGLIAIDFATRRRLRVNGTLNTADAGDLELTVDQAFGNCPQYIQPRQLDPNPRSGIASRSARSSALNRAQTILIEKADTFFLGTSHPGRGADASHRGGPSGFVRVEGSELWWPDYPGNNMFNSFGNLAIDDSAALLFLDFTTGVTLQLSGTASVEWTVPGAGGADCGDDGGTGRRVRFMPREVVSDVGPVRSSTVTTYPSNPQGGDSRQSRAPNRLRTPTGRIALDRDSRAAAVSLGSFTNAPIGEISFPARSRDRVPGSRRVKSAATGGALITDSVALPGCGFAPRAVRARRRA